MNFLIMYNVLYKNSPGISEVLVYASLKLLLVYTLRFPYADANYLYTKINLIACLLVILSL